jgi:hypothetical protein
MGRLAGIIKIMTPSLLFHTMNSLQNLRRGLARLGWLSLLLAPLLAVGCSHAKYQYGLDDHFSMNMIRPPAWLGDPKADLKPAEKEVLQRRGRPDFIRVWWNSDGSLIRSSDLAFRSDQVPQLIKAARKSWIYLGSGEKGEEVNFLRDGASYSAKELSEPIRLICEYGDPERSTPVMVNGEKRETWIWVDRGMKATLVDGKVDSTMEFSRGSGAGTYINR